MKKLLCCFCLLIIFMTGCAGRSSLSSETKTDYLYEDMNYGYYLKEDSFGDHIFRQNKSTKEITLLKSEKIIHQFILSNDWIYYDSVEEQNICRIKTNGKEHIVILNYKSLQEYKEQPITGLWVMDELLFFRMTFELYRYDLQSEKIDKIYTDARQIGFFEKDIYFVGKEASIYKMNIHSNDPQVLLKSESNFSDNNKTNWKDLYKNFIFVDGIMYYYKRNPDGLYRYQNGESTLICNNSDVNEFSLLEHSKKLFFVVRSVETSKLMKYDPASGKTTEVATCNDYSSGSKIKDDYFYYRDSNGKEKQIKIEV